MKRLLIGAVMVGAMAGQLAANSIWSPDPPCGRRAYRLGDNEFPSWGYACDPFYAGNYYYQTPSVSVAMPQVTAPPPTAAPLPPPIRSEMHEYHWPSSPSDSSATTFSIFSKDGRVQSATAVWVQDGVLCYVTPDGSESRMPIDSIDRQATRRRNAEKQLDFWLPAEKLDRNAAHLQVLVSLSSEGQ